MTDSGDIENWARTVYAGFINDGFEQITIHTYTSENGSPLYYKARFKNPATGAKQIRYACVEEDGKISGRRPKFVEGGNPLYNLDLIKLRPDDRVWMVEGESCADALSHLGILATTAGSCTDLDKADLTPLKGRSVVVWEDNDEAGQGLALKIANRLWQGVSRVQQERLGLMDGGDAVDWLRDRPGAAINDVMGLPMVEVIPIAPPAIIGTGLIVISASDLLKLPLATKDKILPWLPAQSITMVHAKRGVGKTHVALGLACSVALGRKFLKWQVIRATKVLYIDGEMPAYALKERLASISSGGDLGLLGANLAFVTPDLQTRLMPDIGSVEGQAAVDQVVGDAELIIVDNLSCLVRAEKSENDAESWNIVQEWALKHRAAGRSILFIHHSGKSGAQRGTSKKEDILDAVINLRQAGDYKVGDGAEFEVVFEKSRHCHGEEVTSFDAKLVGGEWVVSDSEVKLTDKIRALDTEGYKRWEIVEMLGVNKSTVSKALKGKMNDIFSPSNMETEF